MLFNLLVLVLREAEKQHTLPYQRLKWTQTLPKTVCAVCAADLSVAVDFPGFSGMSGDHGPCLSVRNISSSRNRSCGLHFDSAFLLKPSKELSEFAHWPRDLDRVKLLKHTTNTGEKTCSLTPLYMQMGRK